MQTPYAENAEPGKRLQQAEKDRALKFEGHELPALPDRRVCGVAPEAMDVEQETRDLVFAGLDPRILVGLPGPEK